MVQPNDNPIKLDSTNSYLRFSKLANSIVSLSIAG